MVLKIKSLLYDRGFTIAGARRQLAKGKPLETSERDKVLAQVRNDLRDILTLLQRKT
jgi:hypothetical protein